MLCIISSQTFSTVECQNIPNLLTLTPSQKSSVFLPPWGARCGGFRSRLVSSVALRTAQLPHAPCFRNGKLTYSQFEFFSIFKKKLKFIGGRCAKGFYFYFLLLLLIIGVFLFCRVNLS